MSINVYLKMSACSHCGSEERSVYDNNITGNLAPMTKAAGIFKHIWCPEELGITLANDLIFPLQYGLAKLKKYPENFRKFDAPNGWGTYENLVEFVESYLKACEQYPKSTISVY